MLAIVKTEVSARHGRIIRAQDQILDLAKLHGIRPNGSYHLDKTGTFLGINNYEAEVLDNALSVLYEFQSLTESMSSELGNKKAVFLVDDEPKEPVKA